MLAIASWAHDTRSCTIALDWTALGLSPPAVRAFFPDLSALGQSPTELVLREGDKYQPVVTFGPGEGGVLILEAKNAGWL